METKLTLEEVRVLGCLVEKELATPEYYPLSLNALVNACNQKSNREPVMSLADAVVAAALERLRRGGLALQAAEGGRVAKFGHNLHGKLHLSDEETAVVCELLLRGPQTSGELRGRASRMRAFPDVAEVEAVLQGLIQREPPLVAKLPRQPGRKEHRYVHLFGGEPQVEEPGARPGFPEPPAREPLADGGDSPTARGFSPGAVPPVPPVTDHGEIPADGLVTRIALLEEEVRLLRAELEDLRQEVHHLHASSLR